MNERFPESVLVVGCGLIGTSLARAISSRLPDITITGVEIRPDYRATAEECGAFASIGADVPRASGFDLAVLATPVDVACRQLPAVAAVADVDFGRLQRETGYLSGCGTIQSTGRIRPNSPDGWFVYAGADPCDTRPICGTNVDYHRGLARLSESVPSIGDAGGARGRTTNTGFTRCRHGLRQPRYPLGFLDSTSGV